MYIYMFLIWIYIENYLVDIDIFVLYCHKIILIYIYRRILNKYIYYNRIKFGIN